ncbi:hypothetical protein NLG97_g3690 [Lecanicillium saksenae]|uniref:Uncharacterized protein n=1 Tax=Lecanicillium saksenae TaxID=468837 RepID=A0ACC1QXI3_9HYPO|nr:hypothetical protein NLG97_g3690 [Lecanicillium saksenae]
MTSTILPLVIGGKDVQTTETFDVVNPGTGELVQKSSSAGVAEAVLAADAAAAAFPGWSGTHVNERRAILLKANGVLEARSEEIKTILQKETGCDAAWADINFASAAENLVYATSHIVNLEGRMPTVGNPCRQAMIAREPYGVVFSVVPWYV